MLDPRHRVSRLRQSWRALRAALHFLRGLAITTFVFPRVDDARRALHVQCWSEQLLAILAVAARVEGEVARGGNVVFAANHVSWIDIFVIDAQAPSRFIAKSELAAWPLAGRLMRDTGTLFIERARRADTRRINEAATAVLARGANLAVFPEGTTTDGTTLLKFHGSLLQPAIDSLGYVQPIALRYTYLDGSHSLAPEYAGDTTFARSFWRICGARGHVVEVIANPPVAAVAHTRRQLADLSEAAIRGALAMKARARPASATAPPADGASRGRRQ